MINLNPKQKRQLKALANTAENRVQLGKNEITESFIDMLDKSLTSHELVKVDLLKTVETPIKDVALELSSATDSVVVQIIGHVVVLYRPNNEKPNHIVLVK